MKFVEIKENFKKGVNKGFIFVKDHKVEICLTAVTVGSIVGLVLIGRKLYMLDTKHKSLNLEGVQIKDFLKGDYKCVKLSEATRLIDEEIFTELAPDIESLVLNETIEKGGIERSFTLQPTLHKLVTVTVEAIHGD